MKKWKCNHVNSVTYSQTHVWLRIKFISMLYATFDLLLCMKQKQHYNDCAFLGVRIAADRTPALPLKSFFGDNYMIDLVVFQASEEE